MPTKLGVRKVVKLEGTLIQLQLKVYYFVAQNDVFGQIRAVRFSVTPIVPNFIGKALFGD